MSQNTPPESLPVSDEHPTAPESDVGAHPQTIARTTYISYDVLASLLRELQPHLNEIPDMPIETLMAYVDASYRGEY